MNKPLVSIVLATYNAQKYLNQQLDSILKQTYDNIEIIICDDNSTDGTIAILNEYQKLYPNIYIYKNSSNLGVVKNFEKCINLANGNYIALSDQDDIWRLDKIEIQMDYMLKAEYKNPNKAILVHSDLEMIAKNGNLLYNSYMSYKNYDISLKRDLSYILGPCSVMGNTILINRRLKQLALPFPPILEVHDYWLAVINELYGYRITIKESLVSYRIHDDNVSNSQTKLQPKLSNLLGSIYKRDFKLPFLDIKRDKTLRYLLDKYELSRDDKDIILHFLKYLEWTENRFKLFFILIKFSFLKKGFIYRLGVFLGLILKKV
jgi:rhamnosyltransferase